MILPHESSSLDAIIPALCKAKLEFPSIEKATKGARSKYASLEDYLQAVNPCLGAHGLLLSQAEQSFIEGEATTLYLVTTIYHTSGQFIRSIAPLVPPQELQSKGTDNIFQLYGAQLTYRKRYMIASLLGITAINEDDDGELLNGTHVQRFSKPYPKEPGDKTTKGFITKDQINSLEAAVSDLPDLKDRFLKSRNISHFGQLQADKFDTEYQLIQHRAHQEREEKQNLKN